MRAVLLILAALFLLPLTVQARRDSPRLSLRRAAPFSHQVVIADQLVMVIDTAPKGQTPATRVDAINARLVEIIATEPLVPEKMWLKHQGSTLILMVGRHELTEVTPADARANRTTVPVLARFWLANLKRILPMARPAARR